MPAMSRRQWLRGAGLAGTASVLAACTSHASSAPPSTAPDVTAPSAPPSAAASPVASAGTGDGVSAPDWPKLAAAMKGRLLRPGGHGYADAAPLYDRRFTSKPQAIAVVATAADVAAAIRFAAEARVPFAMRSGGHSYEGWSTSTGLQVDVSGLNRVTVDRSSATARIGAGTKLVDVYTALAAHGFGIPGGSCPTVGVTGLTLGGGVGLLTRAWGLTCDVVRSIDVVTADGVARTVSAKSEPGLFWALRGGGGGSFGAVTGFTMSLRPAPTVSTFYLTWPFGAAHEMIDAWQHWIAKADKRLTSTCKLLTDPGPGRRTAMVAGTWIGPASELSAQLAPLLKAVGTPSERILHSHGYADAMLLEAGCSGRSASSCVSYALAPAQRQPFAATSSIMNGTLSGSAIDAAVGRATAALHVSELHEAGVSFDSLGGEVTALAADDTAFGHRTARATVQYTATWTDPATSAAKFSAFVRGSRAAMTPHLGGGGYVNYCDAAITDYPAAYWGSGYVRLQQVKRQYDPHALFTFPQSVRP